MVRRIPIKDLKDDETGQTVLEVTVYVGDLEAPCDRLATIVVQTEKGFKSHTFDHAETQKLIKALQTIDDGVAGNPLLCYDEITGQSFVAMPRTLQDRRELWSAMQVRIRSHNRAEPITVVHNLDDYKKFIGSP